ncbi:MAG: TlpA family protein disulfide reductase [Clostridia bacterium]|nr:TlpA family protein disulfide reductase [Clostridia bacterium]MBN2882169.1 TlpA family protein disulfide reductase [Clostridia bacterium]
MKSKKIIGVMALALSVLFVLSACTVGNVVTEGNIPNDNTPKEEESTFKGDAYNFSLVDTNGETYSLEDFSGKKVYVKFWATWCPSCLEGLEELGQLPALAGEDIVVLSVVAPGYSGEKSSTKFIEWYEGQELTFTTLLDEGGNTFYEYGIRAVPSSFFIDTNGNLVETRLGHVGNEEILRIFDGIS